MQETATIAPFARATITESAVTLNPWNPGLIGLGPRQGLLGGLADGTVLADLRIDRREDGNELIVEVIAGELGDETMGRLLAWACDAGYIRVWLPERVVCLELDKHSLGIWRTECPTCGVSWSDKSMEFLANVRRSGWFPGLCWACGGSLPEWTLEPTVPRKEMTFGQSGPTPAPEDAAITIEREWAVSLRGLSHQAP